jgi:peptidyl-prolyl cis-trans isomerase A (cyclophilin A)
MSFVRIVPVLVALSVTSFGCEASPVSSQENVRTPAPVQPARPADPQATRPTAPPRLVPRPTSPDPEAGSFTLDEALAGLPAGRKLFADITTSLGAISCELLPEKAPITVANFVGLARGLRPWWDPRSAEWKREPHYAGTTFHRVIPDFMIQGGDVLGTGTGEPGYVFTDEMHADLRHDRAGQLCMANRGPNTNGAQFFITDAPATNLDRYNSYTIFGQCQNLDVVSAIARVPQRGGPTNRPNDPPRIESITIRRGN